MTWTGALGLRPPHFCFPLGSGGGRASPEEASAKVASGLAGGTWAPGAYEHGPVTHGAEPTAQARASDPRVIICPPIWGLRTAVMLLSPGVLGEGGAQPGASAGFTRGLSCGAVRCTWEWSRRGSTGTLGWPGGSPQAVSGRHLSLWPLHVAFPRQLRAPKARKQDPPGLSTPGLGVPRTSRAVPGIHLTSRASRSCAWEGTTTRPSQETQLWGLAPRSHLT